MVLNQKDGESEVEVPEPFKNVVLQMKLKVDQPSQDPQQGDKRSFISIVSSFQNPLRIEDPVPNKYQKALNQSKNPKNHPFSQSVLVPSSSENDKNPYGGNQ